MTYSGYGPDTGEQEDKPLTPEEKKQLRLGYLWRYGCPALILVLAVVFNDRIREAVALGMLLYAALTYGISRRPSAAFVFVLKKKRGDKPAYPGEETELKRFRDDGRWMSLVYLFGAVMLTVLVLTAR